MIWLLFLIFCFCFVDFGVLFGVFVCGLVNVIIDVCGVCVGYVMLYGDGLYMGVMVIVFDVFVVECWSFFVNFLVGNGYGKFVGVM